MRSELRSPLLRATLGGVELGGVISAEIDSNNHFAADRFRLRFAASVIQQDVLHVPGVQIEIEIGLGGDWVSCLVGLIDTVTANPTQGIIDVEGRDLSSQLIETQVDETFANRTASEVATLLGSRHGLSVLADTTVTPVGRYYQSEHDRLSLGQYAKTTSEWDLLAALAAREGFDMFMIGRVLRFGFPVLSGAAELQVRDCISLQLGHSVALARPIDVLVKSWNSKTGTMVSGQTVMPGIGPNWQRRVTRPNLSSADAQLQSQKLAVDLKRHEWTASITMPGELALAARSVVLIVGTNTLGDRLYTVSHISRKLDVKRGFVQSLNLQGIA